MKPSNFKTKPISSVLQKSESETIACNIMVILSRTGDTFRPLSWNEYRTERKKDGDFREEEKPYFDRVIDYCESPDTARLFSPVWEQAYLKANEDKQPIDDNELRDKSLKWWVNLGHEQAGKLRDKYFPTRSLLTADERLEIYLSEHKQPIVEGFTKGQIFLDEGDFDRTGEPDELYIRGRLNDENFDICNFGCNDTGFALNYATALVARYNQASILYRENKELREALQLLSKEVNISSLKLNVKNNFSLLNAKANADKLLTRINSFTRNEFEYTEANGYGALAE